jgi:hypothetical protein
MTFLFYRASSEKNLLMLCNASLLRLRELSAHRNQSPPRYNLLHQTTGEVCNTDPLTQAEVDWLRDALPERSNGPSPGPLPTRPHHGAAEVVAGGCPTMEGSAARACPGSAGGTPEEGGSVATIDCDPGEEVLFPAEHPFIRLEPVTATYILLIYLDLFGFI